MHEAVNDLRAEIEYTESAKQGADIFTKDLAPAKWDHAVKMLGIQIAGNEEPFMQMVPLDDSKATAD